jgi:hypothetical protein
MQKLFLILLLCLPSALFAAVAADTTKPKTVPFVETIKSNSFFVSDSIVYKKLPDSLGGLQKFNPVYPLHYRFLGNLGSAHQPLIFNSIKPLGPDEGRHQLDLWFFNNDSVNYYKTNRRFTELYYMLGSKREQILDVTHSQTVFKGLNIGFDFKRITTEGNLNRQYVYGNNFNAFLRYSSPKQRYHILANGAYNRLSSEENGGIVRESDLNDEGKLTKNIAVNILQAESRWGNGSLFLQQSFDLKRDSSRRKSFSRVSHSVFYESRYFLYEDHNPISLFYPTPLYPDLTLDSTSIKNLKNQLSWNYFGKNKYNLTIQHQQYRYKQFIVDNGFNRLTMLDSNLCNISVEAGYFLTILKEVKTSLDFDMILSGNQTGDNGAKCIGYLDVFSGNLGIEVSVQQRSPDIVYSKYYGNNFQWSNNFEKTYTKNHVLFYRSPRFKLKAELRYTYVNNYIYFNTQARPEQYKDKLEILQAVLEKNFKWRKWGFDNFICYQQSSLYRILRLPDLTTSHSLYYENNFFKRALVAQIGTDVRYNSYNYGDAYMPATGQFYLQNSKLIGNYPVIDVFLNFRIKSARMSLKYEHVNYRLFPGGVNYLVPNSPMPGRVLKLAISWRFLD